MTSWILAEQAAIGVLIRVPLAHFADKYESKRSWFLWGLGMSFVSNFATAFGSSVPLLFISRSMLALSSSIMWVVGISTVANVVSVENTGKAYAAVSVAVSSGSSCGPMIAGILLDTTGYWPTWASTLVLLFIDTTFRLLMVEKKSPEKTDATDASHTKQDSVSERSPLLATEPQQVQEEVANEVEPNFYWCVFRKKNFVAGVFCAFMFGLMTATFAATVPLHTRDTFHWGGSQSGLVLGLLQAPRLVMSPFVGWLKDRVGTRAPSVFGFLLMAPFIWVLGVPGNDTFATVVGDSGPSIYVFTTACIGVQRSFLNGLGPIEATVAVNELQTEYPGKFGPNGGKSRALAISGVATILGSCVGPIFGGLLNEQFGYYVMNCVLVRLRGGSG
ncbi:hypothetical protein N7478_006417 [Penicillium angulare]|uniref:uncharacterized protein n=1 Tax=Penicillium angulare TaxID=116970 RepID=UPI00254253FD|nr:uncharacterized protein N7478_006417 [Penicillium angulare]KAJ5281045.1 hypothetical protein N7478_006417 [Penicillium angulare]